MGDHSLRIYSLSFDGHPNFVDKITCSETIHSGTPVIFFFFLVVESFNSTTSSTIFKETEPAFNLLIISLIRSARNRTVESIPC